MKQALQGIKVAAFTWVAVGPITDRTLAEHGATVVRIESHRRPDMARLTYPYRDFIPGINRAGTAITWNTNKYSTSLDLTNPKGKDVARKLIAWADIVTEGFSPGTMKKLGLDYEEVRKIKPDIIYYSTSSQGQYGPYAKFGAYGQHSAAMAGFPWLCGRPDRNPVSLYGSYTDWIAPWYLVINLMGALARKRKTGKGMYLDESQVEAGTTLLAPAILDYTVNERIMTRNANHDPRAAPHGVYPCKGDDRWVAIAVFTDEEWQAFCKTIGDPERTREERFKTFNDRKENEDELDRLVAEWTRSYTAEQVMAMMQSAGVSAGVVQSPGDLYNDPQLEHREHFLTLEHPVVGPYKCHNEASRFSRTPPVFRRAGPCLGEDNEYVLKEILRLNDNEISDLYAGSAITTEDESPSLGAF